MHPPSNVVIADTTSISTTFPGLPDGLIERENLTYALKEILATSAELLMVEGAEGIGKTTLLAQFAKANPDRCISLFLSGSSTYAYDPNMVITEICDQIGWILEKDQYRNRGTDSGHELLSSRILHLQRKTNYERICYYFIIDGLHEIPESDSQIRDRVFALLPFGVPRFKFLISGSPEILGERQKRLKSIRSFQVVGFSIDETRQYFHGENVKDSDIHTIHRLCNMKPGNIASLKRLVGAGVPLSSVIDGTSSKQPDWLKLEWNKALETSDRLRDVVGILAFYRSHLDLDTLAALCSYLPGEIEEELNRCSVLNISSNGEVSFVCDAFRRMALKELAPRRKTLMEKVLRDLYVQPTSQRSLLHLPEVLFEAGEHKKLLEYLSEDTLSLTIDACDSWIPLHTSLQLAINSASKLDLDAEMIRLSIKNSALISLESSDPWREEIEAYLATEDYKAISVIIEKAPTKEDRLQLLAIFARSRREKKLPQDPVIDEQLLSLYQQIDTVSLGKRGFKIATDLLYSYPEIAIELVQKCTPGATRFTNPDIAMARMSIAALFSDIDGKRETHKELSDKIKDPAIQKYVNTLSLRFGTFSASAVLKEVQSWEKPEDRIVALRGWLKKNKRNRDANLVMAYALETALKATSYTANAGVYREIISPLPFIDDVNEKRSIVARIDGLSGVLDQIGPTTELIRLKCILAASEYGFNRQTAFNRLQDVLFFIDTVEDFSTKMECYAILVANLESIDKDHHFESQFLDLATEGLQESAEAILAKTASHYSAIRPAISILAATRLPMALEVVQKLNTRKRRDRAFFELANVVSQSKFDSQKLGDVFSLLSKITSDSVVSSAAAQVIENLNDSKDEITLCSADFKKLESLAKRITSPESRCTARVRLLGLSAKCLDSIEDKHIDSIKNQMFVDWENTGCGWDRVRIGFAMVKLLAEEHPELARDLIQRTELLRTEIVFDTYEAAGCYIGCTRLVIRSFTGLIKQGAFVENDVERICDLISRIPCKSNRISGFAELAIRFHSEGRKVECEAIVSKKIRPMLATEFEDDRSGYYESVSSVAVALYCGHPTSTLQMIDGLPEDHIDEALSEICKYLTELRNPFEGYGHSFKVNGRLNYELFTDVILVIDKMRSDSSLCWAIESVVEGFDPKRFKQICNKNQIADVISKLKVMADSKLPNCNYIKHEGYKIIVESLILKLGSESTGWDELLMRARQIPNYADSCLVLMIVAKNMPKKIKDTAVNVMKEAFLMIPSIPFIEDRLHHFENLAQMSSELDKELSKDIVKLAWRETIPQGSYDMPNARKRLIDFAHRLDEEFASSLASELNVDQGRELARREANERIEVLKLRENIADADTKEGGASDEESCVEVARMLLEGLNTGRGTTMHLSKTRRFIEVAANLHMDRAYFIQSWVVENAVRRFKDSGNVNVTIRPLFDASVMASDLAYRIAARKRAVADKGIKRARASEFQSGLIRPGDRERALEEIRSWAQNAKGSILISDPFFGLEELQLIKTLRDANQEIAIHVVTSRKHQNDTLVDQPWEESYQSYWRLRVADIDPGDVKISVVGRESTGEHPIHDRWCLCEGSGLRIGTSFNSIGILKCSEISRISEADAVEMRREIMDLVYGDAAKQIGGRVRRTSFEL